MMPQIYYSTPEGMQSLADATPQVQDMAIRSLRTNGQMRIEREWQIPIGRMEEEARKSAGAVQEQLDRDVAAIDRENTATRQANAPILMGLAQVTGQSLGEDRSKWARWATDQEGYAVLAASTQSIPTTIEQVSSGYVPTLQYQVVETAVRSGHSCFGAGTMVRTVDGSRPIETLSAGDRVLVQDPATGALGYQPIVAVFHNPPNATLRITLDKEPVVVTGIHRFWKAGQGWAMARDLKVGDAVRTLGGVATVTKVADDQVQPVFNLEVAQGRSFLVGAAGALVHDNSLVEPVAVPFDAPARRAE